jgi:hypothetical protein
LAGEQRAANVPEGPHLEQLVAAIPPVRGRRGRPRRHPPKRHADNAYDAQAQRRAVRRRKIRPRSARRGIESRARRGAPALEGGADGALAAPYRRLRIRYERRDAIHEAFFTLGRILILWNVFP